MNTWCQFAKNLASLDEGLSDAVRTLYGPPEAVSGDCEWDATPPDEKKDEGYWKGIENACE